MQTHEPSTEPVCDDAIFQLNRLMQYKFIPAQVPEESTSGLSAFYHHQPPLTASPSSEPGNLFHYLKNQVAKMFVMGVGSFRGFKTVEARPDCCVSYCIEEQSDYRISDLYEPLPLVPEKWNFEARQIADRYLDSLYADR